MEAKTLYAICALLLAVALVSSTACHLILPYEEVAVTTEPPYFYSAQIYRPIPGTAEEFTEEWECYAWPDTANPYTDATAKVNEYITNCMAPGFAWSYRNLTTLPIVKEQAVDCEWTVDDLPISPIAYGAPFGAELRWNYPDASQGYAYVSLVDKNGDTRTAEPGLGNAYADFAERTGLPDGGTYVRGQPHIRFSDIFIALDTPFQLGSDLTVTKFYIQSIGTLIAENVAGVSYQVKSYDSKFFLYAQGEKDGETGTTSFCFTNEYLYGFTEYQGPPYPFFTFSLTLGADILEFDMLVKVSLSKPQTAFSFYNHQPYVSLVDTQATGPTVDLAANLVWDGDDNLDRFYWFEDFEAATENFLGQGETLSAVPFSVGDHEVTLVAYDTYGSYNSDMMTLTVLNAAPQANDDAYSMDEDSVLTIPAPGLLANDTDAEGDPLTALLENGPSNGTLIWNGDGGFTYTPNPNYTGTDSFTYRANDGMDGSAPATVTITVEEVPEDEETEDLSDVVNDLLGTGALNAGQASSLTFKLNQAIAKIQAAKTKVACNLLKAFINEVNSLISDGVLSSSDGQPLIDKANNIRAELGCS
ncbi:MAG: cadherin-like domain-containing protein [Phycisphaerales bacterium]|nr:MAG: cadherin-like domain-containing protein [Phycisphaerales bacterium]